MSPATHSAVPPAGSLNLDAVQAALERARATLWAQQSAGGHQHWPGQLSSSALSTATAVTALAIVQRTTSSVQEDAGSFGRLIEAGLGWLAHHQNEDGGWGDTTKSLSNISTTTLGWAAFGAVPGADQAHRETVARAASWLTRRTGGVMPDQIAPAIIARYGKDRTFSVPILTHCALAGRLGSGREAWRHVLPLPFELAALPHQLFAALRLPVVSYALPALIAIGQARFHYAPPSNPASRLVRGWTRARTLGVLTTLQPANGGFLEATPLTSFVTMSLAGSGQADHIVARRGVRFLQQSQRPDGSWPIDTNLSTWVTTLAVNALGSGAFQPAVDDRDPFHEPPPAGALSPGFGGEGGPDRREGSGEGEYAPVQGSNAGMGAGKSLPAGDRSAGSIRAWLLAQQYQTEHPYTHAAPGGWAWTDLPGGVPDADDTAGALLALRQFGPIDDDARAAAVRGIEWLLSLQNRDGGIPTFCRGWGALPFDRSSADITAHAVRAWIAWGSDLPAASRDRVDRGMARAQEFLARAQRPDGSWLPLWFGNQLAPDDGNPLYGTTRVLCALADISGRPGARSVLQPGVQDAAIQWVLRAQNADGGWGGAAGVESSVEETALAVEALAVSIGSGARAEACLEAWRRGVAWLVRKVEDGSWTEPSPIGFYFAKLWYYEQLYPLIFAVAALRRSVEVLETNGA